MQSRPALLAGAALSAILAGAPLATPAMAEPLPAAATYADLLEPVPGAGQMLEADDANRAAAARLQPAQYWANDGYEYHHHHQWE